MAKGRRELGGSPREIKDVALEILPRTSQIFGKIELFVDFTRLVILIVLARGPTCSKSPGSLLWMEVELMDSLSRVESS